MIRVIIAGFLFLVAVGANAQQAAPGKSVSTVKVLSSSDKPVTIPFIGEKVVVVLYTDPDVKDVNDPLSQGIKAKGFPSDKYSGIGIANCKVTWIPNAAIRMKSRQKEQQFPGSIVLIDDAEKVKSAWGLSDCDGKGVVVVIGKDAKIKYLHYVKTQDESKSIISAVTKIIQEEIAK